MRPAWSDVTLALLLTFTKVEVTSFGGRAIGASHAVSLLTRKTNVRMPFVFVLEIRPCKSLNAYWC